MKVISSLDEAKERIRGSVVALGNFDGIHEGHQELIKMAVSVAKAKGLSSVVFTFTNHPKNEISGKQIVKMILSAEEKAQILEKLGIDFMVSVKFDKEIMQKSPEDFVNEILLDSLKMKYAVCGFNYSFGYKGEGTAEKLIGFGKEKGFSVSVVPEVDVDGSCVSSTRIRELISAGDMKGYIDCVNRPYSIQGTVVTGNKLGRKMGFPTINLNLSDAYALPANGVYVTKTYVNNIEYKSVTNVGKKPTIGSYNKNAETHIFDFDEDIYGQTVTVKFMHMLRAEKKFESIEELEAQIKQDCIDAQNYSC